jgi:hypothetical protein
VHEEAEGAARLATVGNRKWDRDEITIIVEEVVHKLKELQGGKPGKGRRQKALQEVFEELPEDRLQQLVCLHNSNEATSAHV